MSTSYDLRSLELPRLTGLPLRVLVEALEAPISGPLVAARLFQDSGFTAFRAKLISDPPTFHPPVHDHPLRAGPPTALASVDAPPAAGFPWLRIRELAAAYRAKRTDPLEVAERVIRAIAALDGGSERLGLMIAHLPEDLRAQARASAERHARGAPLGPLDGVPIGVKDELDQLPYPTTGGTRFLGRNPPAEDATTVARLRAQGALLFGKLSMHEIGINPFGSNEHYGFVRNPFDRARDTGGSSSGSAAAVAMGLCPAALGADGGGSIRVPAALTGIVGLKPTYGRVSEHGAVPLCWSVAHVGPMGASVEDVALVYLAIAGPDAKDALSLAQPAPSLERLGDLDLRGLRVGVYGPWFRHAAPAVVEACEGALRKLDRAGLVVKEIELLGLEEIRVAHAITILSEMARAMETHAVASSAFGLGTRVNLQVGRSFSARDYLKAQQVRTRALATFARAFEAVDVIATPTTGITAPKIPVQERNQGWSDLSVATELMRFVAPLNFTGHPALSLPVGYDGGGLPIGLQLVGPHFAEDVLFRVAHLLERETDRRAPVGAVRLLDLPT